MTEVRDRTVARLLDPRCTDVVRHLALYAVLHEDVHTETITYTRQTLGYPAPQLPGRSGTTAADVDAGPLPGDVEVPRGMHLLGALRADPFAYDNEKWAPTRCRAAPARSLRIRGMSRRPSHNTAGHRGVAPLPDGGLDHLDAIALGDRQALVDQLAARLSQSRGAEGHPPPRRAVPQPRAARYGG